MPRFRQIEYVPCVDIVNEFGNEIKIGVQGGNCTAMGDERAMEKLSFMLRDPESITIQTITILEARVLRDLLDELLLRVVN